jgi:AraC-like DNA-binding protein
MHNSKTIKLKKIGFVELLQASFTKQSFNKHFHEEFCFGVLESGQLEFNYRGAKVTANKGHINLCNPGEVHDGFTKTGWSYRMFYVDPLLMKEISSDISGKHNDIPFFKEGIIEDKVMSQQLLSLHKLMSDEQVFTIEKEELFLNVVAAFIKKHADSFIPLATVTSSKPIINHVINYINDNLSAELLVSELSQQAGFSLFYFIRAFKKEMGLTPKEYIIQQRINKATTLIKKQSQLPLTQIALECGFYDQSHMNKYFKSYKGLTPSIYQ